MPELQGALVAPWGRATPLAGATVLPWGRATPLQAFGTAYTPPAPPGGGTPFTPGDLTAPLALAALPSYHQAHTLTVMDLRTATALQVDSVRISLDDGAAFWTFSAEGPPELYGVLTTGEQPARLQVVVDGQAWAFVVETATRPRSSTRRRISFGGRSVAAVADAPYQFALTYSAEAPTTAAQLCAGALLAAGVALDWMLADWLIPAGAVSIQGTPMDVVRAVAGAVGAMVTAHPSEYRITVQSRYELLPNEWAAAVPDVQVHSDAVESETSERADRPAYTGVFVAGQQGGALGYVQLQGTSGADQAPMVTDPLLTDEAALRERGRAVLGAGGQQARVSRTLPVRTGAGEPGVLERGALLRCVDAADNGAPGQSIWHGLVRSVALTAQLPVVQQTVAIERHTAWVVDPDTSEPLVLVAPVPNQSAVVGAEYAFDLTPYRSGGKPPYTWTMRAGALPDAVGISGEALAGTPATAGLTTGLRLRLADSAGRMVDTPEFTFTASSPATGLGDNGTVLVKARFDGTPGSGGPFSNEGTLAGEFPSSGGFSHTDALVQQGTTSLTGNVFAFTCSSPSAWASALQATVSEPVTFDAWIGVGAGSVGGNFHVGFNYADGANRAGFSVLWQDGSNAGVARLKFRQTGLIDVDTEVSRSVLHHFCFSIDENDVVRAFVDGVLVATNAAYTGGTGLPSPAAITVQGGSFAIATPFYLDNLRFQTGYAQTTEFTPPPTV